MEYGWGLPLKLDVNGKSIGKLKPKQEWDKLDNDGSEVNIKALFSILNGVCLDEFCKIANYTLAKEAWNILQVTHEATSIVKVYKLQILTFRFENIRMQENQNFFSFYSELSDIVNSSFNLGEPIPYFKVVRKSLLERFLPKVIAIEENKEIGLMRIDELVGSIKIYVMTIPNSQRVK